jgi:hypothetical protein
MNKADWSPPMEIHIRERLQHGDIYSGDWKNDLCHGSCILTFASESDDSSYCGRWMGGRFHGKGRFMAWRK